MTTILYINNKLAIFGVSDIRIITKVTTKATDVYPIDPFQRSPISPLQLRVVVSYRE